MKRGEPSYQNAHWLYSKECKILYRRYPLKNDESQCSVISSACTFPDGETCGGTWACVRQCQVISRFLWSVFLTIFIDGYNPLLWGVSAKQQEQRRRSQRNNVSEKKVSLRNSRIWVRMDIALVIILLQRTFRFRQKWTNESEWVAVAVTHNYLLNGLIYNTRKDFTHELRRDQLMKLLNWCWFHGTDTILVAYEYFMQEIIF